MVMDMSGSDDADFFSSGVVSFVEGVDDLMNEFVVCFSRDLRLPL